MFDIILQDARFAFRQLRRNPGFAIVAIATLALGLGATTAFFSLANALLLKELPVPDPQQLVAVTHGTSGARGPSLSYPLFNNLSKRDEVRGVELFSFSYASAQFIGGPIQRKVGLQIVSGNFYPALHVRPQLGRLLERANNRTSDPFSNAAVISDRFWQGALHADAAVLGKRILLDNVPFVVIGVSPRTFFGVVPGTYPDITITMAGFALLTPHRRMLDCRSCNWAEAMGRLKPGVSVSQAQAGLRVAWQSALRETVPENLPERYRESYFADQLFLEAASSGPESYLRNRFAKPLFVLLGMSGLILLVACTNVANLLLARAQSRQKEMAVRLSTGAPRRRILQQLLTECLILALLSLTASTAVYELCVRGLLWFMRRNGQDVFLNTVPDVWMLGFIVALVLLTVLIFGLAPAIRASRASLRGTLAESAATIARKSKLGAGILSVEVALSLTLLTGAALLARSLHDLRTFDAGFRRDHLLIASPEVSKAIPRDEDQLKFERRLIARIEELPGVRSASASVITPVVGGIWMADFVADGYPPQGKEDRACYLNFVSPRFFATMGTPFLVGRDFTAYDDRAGAPAVAIVSESLARHFWGDQNPIGKLMHEVDKPDRITVVGVVRDSQYRSLREDAVRTVYLRFPPPTTRIAWNFQVEIWTVLNPEALATSVRAAFQHENSQVPVEIQTFDELLGRHLLYERLLTAIAVGFGVLGLLMAAIGVYGVAAYSVSRRTMEIGIRVALGATKPQLVWLFLGEHLMLTFVGLAIGMMGALGLTRFLRAWLFGVSSGDVPSFAASAVLLAGVSVVATLTPAVRALRFDPSQLLRHE